MGIYCSISRAADRRTPCRCAPRHSSSLTPSKVLLGHCSLTGKHTPQSEPRVFRSVVWSDVLSGPVGERLSRGTLDVSRCFSQDRDKCRGGR